MIQSSFNRLGLLVQNAVLTKLRQPRYLVAYRKLIQEYSSIGGQMAFRLGRVKVSDAFPLIGIEALSRKDTWAATNYTKDLEFRFRITLAVKAVSGQQVTEEVDTDQAEQFCISLAEFLLEILNEPIDSLQYEVTTDQDGNTLAQQVKIYDSLVDNLTYGYLYSGALRSAELTWFGKIMRVGPTGGLRGYGVGAFPDDARMICGTSNLGIGVSSYILNIDPALGAAPVVISAFVHPPVGQPVIELADYVAASDGSSITFTFQSSTGVAGYTLDWRYLPPTS